MKKNLFVTIAFSRLRKSEFRDLVNLVVEFLIQNDLEAMNLGFVSDNLKKAQAELQLLHVPYGVTADSAILKVKRESRIKLLRAIVAQIKALRNANTVLNIPDLDKIAAFVERYLNPIVTANSSTITDVLTEMFSTLDNDSSLSGVLTNLNLQSLFDELRILQSGYTQTLVQRSNVKSVRLKISTGDVRENAEIALSKLIKEIELMQMKNSTIDYQPLINNLNNTFTSYMTLVKSRSTTKKRIDAKSKVSTINATTAQNGNSGAVA